MNKIVKLTQPEREMGPEAQMAYAMANEIAASLLQVFKPMAERVKELEADYAAARQTVEKLERTVSELEASIVKLSAR